MKPLIYLVLMFCWYAACEVLLHKLHQRHQSKAQAAAFWIGIIQPAGSLVIIGSGLITLFWHHR